MALKPVGSGISFATSGAAAVSSFISHQSEYIRVVATGAAAHVAVGTNPTATTTDVVVITGEPEILSIGRPSSQRVVAITTGTTTTIDFPEGTGSPFEVGDIVSLTINSTAHHAVGTLANAYVGIITDVGVLSVNNTAGFSGFHNTRITLNANTSGIKTAFNFQYAELRDQFKVSAEAIAGTGMFYAQQIQTAGGPS
tara:strand:- start:402 stop:992 length:591 start_codon:yes stop_codon:yes gene_type:complete